VIIVGSGAGGGTLAHRLAPTGKRILILERGRFLPREKENWEPAEVFGKDRYHTTETWEDGDGKAFRPGTGYWVGGNTKVYGGAMFRLRERDFDEVVHKGGISPAWPLTYRDLEPYYVEAETLYQVHGLRGADPTEPWSSAPYPHPPVSHEPRIEELRAGLAQRGHHPFPLPLCIRLDEADPERSACIRCSTCDGFPCLVDAKSDADIACVRPIARNANVELVLGARVTRLLTQRDRRQISGVEAEVDGELHRFEGDLVVVAAGAVNTAALLLASASDAHPRGLANSSDQVGRNYMRHLNAVLLGVTSRKNPSRFQKTLAVNDYYWGDPDFPYPMGHLQLMGKTDRDILAPQARYVPRVGLGLVAAHSIDWWLTAEDLPHPDNRVVLGADGRIGLHVRDRYREHFDRLVARWTAELKDVDASLSIYLRRDIPIGGVGHQCGTCRFGADPRTSVLDRDCRAHDVDNLYVVDGSFFCSSGAVNPSLTIAANALRVADHLIERLG
jgi:choline dehydrogenase-like flavoprotein